MKLKVLLAVTAVYMGILGLGFLLLPAVVGMGVVPEDASAALIAYLRIPASVFISIAVLNWMSRNSESSSALNAIVTANIVGFTLAALLEILNVFSGNRMFALVFAVIHIFFSVSFLLTIKSAKAAAANA